MEEVERLKAEANELFKAKDYLKAAAAYTKALKLDKENAVLLSNRSAALLKLNKVTKALEDAEACITLTPAWEKGYFRKGAIQESQQDFAGAYESYSKALEVSTPSGNADLAAKVAAMGKKIGKKPPSEKKAADAVPPPPAPKSKPPPSPVPAPPPPPASSKSLKDDWDDLGTPETAHFVNSWIGHLVAEVREDGRASLEPMVHFQIGLTEPTEDQEKFSHIRASAAFQSPETTLGFVDYLRKAGKSLKATTVCAIVPKSKVAFPQVWSREGWPSPKEQDGVIFQVESNGGGKKLRKVWFFPFPPSQGSANDDRSLGSAVGLDPELFSLLPTLLQGGKADS